MHVHRPAIHSEMTLHPQCTSLHHAPLHSMHFTKDQAGYIVLQKSKSLNSCRGSSKNWLSRCGNRTALLALLSKQLADVPFQTFEVSAAGSTSSIFMMANAETLFITLYQLEYSTPCTILVHTDCALNLHNGTCADV